MKQDFKNYYKIQKVKRNERNEGWAKRNEKKWNGVKKKWKIKKIKVTIKQKIKE